MKRNLIYISVVLIFAHVLLEAGELSERFWPDFANKIIRPIQSNSFHPKWYVDDGIYMSWWIKMNCDDLVWIMTFMMMATVALKYSEKLFFICFLFFGYHVLDYFMLWWDYKTSHWVYWILNGLIAISVIILIVPIKDKTAIIKKFNNGK